MELLIDIMMVFFYIGVGAIVTLVAGSLGLLFGGCLAILFFSDHIQEMVNATRNETSEPTCRTTGQCRCTC